MAYIDSIGTIAVTLYGVLTGFPLLSCGKPVQTNPANYTLVGNTTNKLFRLFGDIDGNGAVDALDYAAFRLSIGTSACG